MMHYTTVQALAQAHQAELQRQAQRDTLARADRQARRQQPGHRAPGILAAATASSGVTPAPRGAIDEHDRSQGLHRQSGDSPDVVVSGFAL